MIIDEDTIKITYEANEFTEFLDLVKNLITVAGGVVQDLDDKGLTKEALKLCEPIIRLDQYLEDGNQESTAKH